MQGIERRGDQLALQAIDRPTILAILAHDPPHRQRLAES
jgi:hypothetical protein